MREKEKEKEMTKSNNRIRNFFILIFIFCVCMAFVIYLCELYKVNDEEKKKIPVISGVLSEIYREDFEHYVLDNPTTIIYMCTANDDICRNFERDFKKLLKQKNYREQVIYLNLTDLNQDEFVTHFNERYPYKNPLTTFYPAFVIFEDGSVKTILQGSEKKPLTITKVKQFLELNDLGE